MRILGIETSCDETAAALVDEGGVLAERVAGQEADHAPFGGVVPEIAARAHLERLDGLVRAVMDEAGLGFADLDGIAVASGPGLAGGLIVGTMTARAIAAVHALPLTTVNHLEGHALTARLTDAIAFPYLLLLVSGGHTQILEVRGVGDYRRLATTIDDALGEAFDKTAKLLGLPYPGGPQVEACARRGDPAAFDFPRPLSNRPTLDMSFSGLKTAVRQAVLGEPADDGRRADICASFQAAIGDVVCDRAERAVALAPDCRTLVVAGGVAANRMLRARLEAVADRAGIAFAAPPLRLCTDNAVMIAWAGLERMRAGLETPDAGIRPRWPLDPDAAARLGAGRPAAGRKGAKA